MRTRPGDLGDSPGRPAGFLSGTSWILGIYPALARRRALALRLSHVQPGRTRGAAPRPNRADLLDSLAKNIAVISVDFMQYAESYYFYDGDDRTSLASQVDDALTLADLAAGSDDPAVRQSGKVLEAALEDLAAILNERFLHTAGTPRQILTAYRLDHGQHAGAQA